MKLHFRKTGEGPNIVILHGLFGSSDNWQTFARQLSAHGYSVYTVDLRNHGLSPHDHGFNYEMLAGDVAGLISELHAEPVVIIGHSLGGKTAMTYAFNNPGSVAGLMVIDIAPRRYPVQHQSIIDALQSIDTKKLTSRKDAERQLLEHNLNPAVTQFLLKNLYWKEKDRLDWRFNLPVIAGNIEIVGAETVPGSVFERPTLFVKGDQSAYITEKDELDIKKWFGDVEIKTAPGSGHWVHAENPSWLMETVLNFLKKVIR